MYLGKSRRCNEWTQESVPELWALTIAASAMSDEMRKKYLHEERYLYFISGKIFSRVSSFPIFVRQHKTIVKDYFYITL